MATVNNSSDNGSDNLDPSKATSDPAVNAAIVDNVLGDTDKPGLDRTDAADANESIRLIPFSKLKVDLVRNPRRVERYTADGEAGQKARSLHTRGLVTALVVSERENGDIYILQGHIRYHAMLLLRTTGLPAGTPKADKPAIEADPKAFDKVRCLVKKGLSLAGEMDLVMDHSESFKLDKREQYTAAVRMLRYLSEDLTAKKMGFKSRGPLSKLANVSKMPQCVEDAFMADPKSEGYIDVTDDTIVELFKAYNADLNHKPPLCRIKCAGPNFTKAWESFLANGPTPRNKSVPRTELVALATTTKETDLRELIEGIANGDKDLMNSAYERVTIRLEIENETRLNGGVTPMSYGTTPKIEAIDDTVV